MKSIIYLPWSLFICIFLYTCIC